jgi:TetR/AcrR family transcriptional repressor of nem operon
MKKSREETAQTRQRIVAAAANEFRTNGITATGLADVMAAAGLTQGGFYRHFDSKEQVLEESLAVASESLIKHIEAASSENNGKTALDAAIDAYLGDSHRENPAHGCPFVALGSELARSSESVRDITSAGVEGVLNALAGQIDGATPAAAREQAMIILSTLVGAVSLSRMVNDPALAESFVVQARKHLLQGHDTPAKRVRKS